MNTLALPHHPVFSLAVALTAVASLVSWLVAVYAWRRRPAPGAAPLAVLTAASGVWASGYVVELLASDPGTKLLVANVEWAGVLAAPVAWAAFAFAYSGQDRYTSPLSLIAIATLPMVAFVAVWTNPAHHLMWTATTLAPAAGGDATLLDFEWGPLYWVVLGYGYLLWLTGASLVVRTVLGMPTIYRLQAGALVVGALMPVVANFATTLFELYGAAFDMTPAGFAFAGLACSVALTQYDLLDARPVPIRVARDRVVEEMADAVVVTDTMWRVTDLNERAARLFGAEGRRADLKGTFLSDLVPGYTPAGSFDGTDRPDDDGGGHVVTLDGGQRYVELRTSEFTDYHGRPIGYAVVFRDVTDRRLSLQQLEVMNRVLRHNLRTEANLLFGYADLVVDDLDAGSVDLAKRHAETVQRHALGLADIGDKARKLADLRGSWNETADSATSATAQIQTVVDEVRVAFPDAAVRFGVRPPPDVRCSPVLESVLLEVLENAVEHNPAARPRVSVWATLDGDALAVTVVDDGPGIPPEELAAIEADGETPLQHGSGLGLWLVHWGADSAGGDVAFAHADPSGTRVTVRVPAVRSDPESIA